MNDPVLTKLSGHKLRKAKKSDGPFIASGWLESMRNSSWASTCPNSAYYGYYHEMIAELLSRSPVVVSCSEEDPDVLSGFICAEMHDNDVLVIHFVYVPKRYRGMGVAKSLVKLFVDNEKPSTVFYSFKSTFVERNPRLFKRLREEHGMVYNPFFTIASLPSGWSRLKK